MKQLFFLLALTVLTIAACTDPITVGSDILADDRAEVGQVSDLPFTTRVVRDDSLLVFDADANTFLVPTFSFGHLEDEVFGEWTHSAYFTPRLPRTSGAQLTISPEWLSSEAAFVDSIVLIIPIDTAGGFYGPGRDFSARMEQLLEVVDYESDLTTGDERPLTDGNNVLDGPGFSASLSTQPLYDTIYSEANFRDSLPHIRLKFDAQFVDAINQLDSTSFASDSTFTAFFAGVLLEPTEQANGMLTLSPAPRRGLDVAGFYFYYRDPSPSDDASFYRMPLEGFSPLYEKDYTGTLAEELLQPDVDSTTLLVTGEGGLMTAIEFTDLDALQNTLINRAELTFYTADLAGYSREEFPYGEFMALYFRDGNGNLRAIRDWPNGDVRSSDNEFVRRFLGGFVEMENDDVFFRNRLSIHMQGIVTNNFTEPVVYLRSIPVSSDPSRTILRGRGADELPARMDVTFTRVE